MEHTCKLAARERLDLEQAVALVLSAIVNDETTCSRDKAKIVKSLIREIDHSTVVEICTWMSPADLNGPASSKLSRTILFAARVLSKHSLDVSDCKDQASSFQALQRIRQCRPRDESRCLFMLQWIFDATVIDPPAA